MLSIYYFGYVDSNNSKCKQELQFNLKMNYLIKSERWLNNNNLHSEI